MDTVALEDIFQNLYSSWSKKEPKQLLPLAPSGSPRIYYRAISDSKSAICAFNSNAKENKAFIYLSNHFAISGLPIPKVYSQSKDYQYYLQEDLGSVSLYSLLGKQEVVSLYEKVVKQLARIQIKGHEGLDYNKCLGPTAFDKQSILWDLNLFKYSFLKLAAIPIDEVLLENDFHTFADFLLQAPQDYFMFRDFQSRNIMIKDNEPFFIDYQGGRKGALQYDLVSLLFQAKANLSPETRAHLLETYLAEASQLTSINQDNFKKYYYPYAMVRSMQVLGAYGHRGLYERKKHFLESIPFAIKNVTWLANQLGTDLEIPELRRIWKSLSENKDFYAPNKDKGKRSPLRLDIKSFSYKYGIPETSSSHGGGFVFDCRFMHNPGRYEPYNNLTGRDESVINFLQQHSTMNDFLNNVRHIVEPAVENYLEREFDSLSIYFGCTGGKHRSVYAADQIANYLHEKYGVRVQLLHRERGWETETMN